MDGIETHPSDRHQTVLYRDNCTYRDLIIKRWALVIRGGGVHIDVYDRTGKGKVFSIKHINLRRRF